MHPCTSIWLITNRHPNNLPVMPISIRAKGDYPFIRPNEIRDFTANLMAEVCHNVATEPHLQPITGELRCIYQQARGCLARYSRDLSENVLTLGCSTHSLLQTSNPYAPRHIKTMIKKRDEPTSSELWTLTMPLNLSSTEILSTPRPFLSHFLQEHKKILCQKYM